MKLESIWIVPMIGLGWWDEQIDLGDLKYIVHHIHILCFHVKLTEIKRYF